MIGVKNLKSPYKTNTFSVGDATSIIQKKYVALGDSLSAGVGSSDINHTIVYLYAQELAANGHRINVLNLAWPGDETEEVLKNQLPIAIAEQPDYISLFIGINDMHEKRTLEHFRKNYSFILSELLSKTHAKILVINLPYLGANKLVAFPFNMILDARTKQFNKVIDSLPKNDRIHLVDLYKGSALKLNGSFSNYSSDLFHPSETGYMLWSEIINAN